MNLINITIDADREVVVPKQSTSEMARAGTKHSSLGLVTEADNCYRAMLQAAPKRQQAAMDDVQKGWLLERDHEGRPQWITAKNGWLDWTFDSLEALRLARREDADQLCNIVEDCSKVTEHQWG